MLIAFLLLAQSTDPVDWKQQGIKFVSGNQWEPAIAAFSKACDLTPKDDEACYFLARTLFALGRYPEAREPFEKALQAAPKTMLARVHRGIALNFIALTSPDDAERHFREALKFSSAAPSSDDDPRVDYAAFLFRQGRMDAALPMLEQAVQAQPGSARAHAELGRVLLHLGKKELAVAKLEKAVELDPKLSSARLLLGRAYLELGRKDEGERQLRLGQESWTQRQGSATVR